MAIENKNNLHPLKKFIIVFEWVYDVEIPEKNRNIIFEKISDGWNNEDSSDRELLIRIVNIYEDIFINNKNLIRNKEEIRGYFKNLFSLSQNDNNAEQILTITHQIIEQLRPKITGLPFKKQVPSNKYSPIQFPTNPPVNPMNAHPPQIQPQTPDPSSQMDDAEETLRKKTREIQNAKLRMAIEEMENDMINYTLSKMGK